MIRRLLNRGRRALLLLLAGGLIGAALLVLAAPATALEDDEEEQQTVSARTPEPGPQPRRAIPREPGQRPNAPEPNGTVLNGDGRGALSPGGFAPGGVPVGRDTNRAGPRARGGDLAGWILRGGLALLAVPLAVWVFYLPRRVNRIGAPGFEVITPSEPRQFIPLEEKTAQLDFIARMKTHGSLRLSANLNRVILSNRRFGYLLEDKNFRNALLVNRRRVRRTLLRDGDVLDLGDLTLLYRDHRDGAGRQLSVTPSDGKVHVRFDRMQGPVRRGVPALVFGGQGPRAFYISKNLVFIGRSEGNDLVIKSRDVQNRHAKIVRVGSRYKLQDLSLTGSTYVNNRRIEQRYLREGDEIAFDNHRFLFTLTPKPLVARPAPQDVAPDEAPVEPEEPLTAEDSGGPEAESDRTNS